MTLDDICSELTRQGFHKEGHFFWVHPRTNREANVVWCGTHYAIRYGNN